MRKFICLYIVMALLLLAVLVRPAHADMRFFFMFELAEQSDVVFVGKVTAVTDTAATVTVSKVLSGELKVDEVTVGPIRINTCTGSMVHFSTDEQVLVFGKKTDEEHVTVAADGQGKRILPAEIREAEIATAKRILEIAKLDEHAKNKTMLAEVKSENQRLSFEARHYILYRISDSEQRERYKDDLISLVRDADPMIQWTGLQGIQFIQDPALIPLIAERTRSKNVDIIKAASMALAQYDTPESAAALITLTEHTDPKIRIRANIDLRRSERPESKQALRRMLDDKDPSVRAMGPRGFVYWLRRDQANDVLDKLVGMLDDEDPKVCAEAAHVLGECRNSRLVPPLLKTLKVHPQDKDIQGVTLNALYCHYSKGDIKAKALIDNEIKLITEILTGPGSDSDYRSSFNAVGILDLSPKEEAADALKWAAEHHSNKEIRAYAKRSLSN